MSAPMHDLGYYQDLDTPRLLDEAHIYGLNANLSVAIAERLDRATRCHRRRHFAFHHHNAGA